MNACMQQMHNLKQVYTVYFVLDTWLCDLTEECEQQNQDCYAYKATIVNSSTEYDTQQDTCDQECMHTVLVDFKIRFEYMQPKENSFLHILQNELEISTPKLYFNWQTGCMQ